MKKFYAAAALVLAAFSGSFAQSLPQVDLEAVPYIEQNTVITPASGRGISGFKIFFPDHNAFDSIPALTTVWITGRGFGLEPNDRFFFADPTCAKNANGSLSGYAPTMTQSVDTGSLVIQNRGNLDATDSIYSLLNIENFEADSTTFASLIVNRSELVSGRSYGFYTYVSVWPQDGSALYRDTIRDNNFQYVPVCWLAQCANGLPGYSTVYDNLNIFPNPAANVVNYSLDLKKASTYQTVRVLDMTGRTIFKENKGATPVGAYNNKIDVSALAAGTYTIQVITEYNISATKFTKN